MSNLFTFRRAMGVFAIVGLGAGAGATAVQAQELSPESGFWIRAGGFLRTGVKVDFRDAAAPTPAGAGIFQDGFVLPSISTNSPYTWNWGYQNAAQSVGSTLQFQRLDNAPRVGGLSADAGSIYGGELRAGFEISRFEMGRREVRFGAEAGYGYGTVSAAAQGSAAGVASYQTAQYSILDPNGQMIILPQAPYSGTFMGPGPLISRTPTGGQTVNAAGTSTLDAQLKANLHVLKVGMYFEVPISKRFSGGVSFGYCTVLPDAELTYTEISQYGDSGIPGSQVTRTVRRSDWQPGVYLELRAEFAVTKRLGVFVAAGGEFNENVTFGDGNREATIRLGTVYGGTVGVRWTF